MPEIRPEKMLQFTLISLPRKHIKVKKLIRLGRPVQMAVAVEEQRDSSLLWLFHYLSAWD